MQTGPIPKYKSTRGCPKKLLNALSWNPQPYKFVAVDDDEVLFRIFLPDLNWGADTWGLLEQTYPYGLTGETDPNLRQLTHATNARVPVIRADWFVAAASAAGFGTTDLPDLDFGDEIELEVDPVPAAAPTARSEPEPAGSAEASRTTLADRERARLRAELQDAKRSRGLGDLSQLSFGMQLLVGAIAIGVMVGVVIGVRMLSSTIAPTG